ncbi:MAG: hypothetical protein ACK417_08285 [Bacteroidia bacterium]
MSALVFLQQGHAQMHRAEIEPIIQKVLMELCQQAHPFNCTNSPETRLQTALYWSPARSVLLTKDDLNQLQADLLPKPTVAASPAKQSFPARGLFIGFREEADGQFLIRSFHYSFEPVRQTALLPAFLPLNLFSSDWVWLAAK